MKVIHPTAIALLLAASTFTSPTARSEQLSPVLPPDSVFNGTVTAKIGHELGYIAPQVGDRLELDLGNLDLYEGLLQFERVEGDEVPPYVPLPASLELVDVERRGSVREWQSLRAVAEMENHQVTLDAVRTPGLGHVDSTVVWLVIESGNRTTGVIQLQGVVDGQ